ncbi:MAG: hypothetical protein ACD_24C00205G0002 [uncultured bacterium]|uniref:Uncharacterized protein n=1 Tax=candidate division WWE3 bacterium RBG_16_37_10 TaxID=1802610 RepID=A0A1F4V331_UNCKA|nr:MAG: hypothetical protein ACD_24C00205G0002 [uncultured bacterium]OGC51615.1 MAG: hypothetical protein A2W32_04615 [candidate division WWE3 bacterium RBG_16_37_10]
MKTYDLLTLAEYIKIKLEGLYSYVLSNHSQFLFYIGFKHSNDPTNPDFTTLDEYWSDFMFKTDGKDRIALVEGNIRRYFEDRDKSIIQAGGEGGYLTHLAVKNNIQVLCPELPKDSEINILLLDFTMEQIAYFFFARYMSFHPKFGDTLGFDNKSLLALLQKVVKASSGLDFDYSLDNMAKIHEKLFGTKLDTRDKGFFGQLLIPHENRTVINKVVNKVDYIRDNWIVGEIERLWKEGKSIFIVYGRTHAVIQERAIRKIVEEN